MTEHVLKRDGLRIVFEAEVTTPADPGRTHGPSDGWREPSGAECTFTVVEVTVDDEDTLVDAYQDAMAELVAEDGPVAEEDM